MTYYRDRGYDGSIPWNPGCSGVCPLIYQASTFIGAFPFLSHAPTILDYDAIIRVVAIFTGKFNGIIKGKHDVLHLFFRAFSQYDRGTGEDDGGASIPGSPPSASKQLATQPEMDMEDDDDDELALAALEAL